MNKLLLSAIIFFFGLGIAPANICPVSTTSLPMKKTEPVPLPSGFSETHFSATFQPLPLTGDISGNIHTETNQNMESVTVNLTGPVNMTTVTDASGNYTFAGVPDGTYNVCPELNTNPLNGCSTFDLVLISLHIQNVQLLNTPYKIIAADVTGDGILDPDPTVGDMIVLRKLLLAIISQFPNGVTSWVFVPEDYVFNDPTDPWDPVPPPSCITVVVSGGNVVDVDFIGIKKGDVNNNATP